MSSNQSQNIPLHLIRKAAAEILAYAVVELFPGSKLIAGNVSDLGFHYDFFIEQPINEEMLPFIEEKMRGIVKENLKIEMQEMMRENAMEMFRFHQQPGIVDLLKDEPANIVQIWKMGTFYDACKGPYPAHTGVVQAFKLQNIQREPSNVIRITGTACSDKAELKSFLKKLEAFKKNDHRLLGPEMGLFAFQKEGLFWLPRGKFVKDALIHVFRAADEKLGMDLVTTPGDEKSLLHGKLYSLTEKTETDLPVRYSEISENSETAHIFCTTSQAQNALISCLQSMDQLLKLLNFKYFYLLCPGNKNKRFHQSIEWLTESLNANHLQFVIDKDEDSCHDTAYDKKLFQFGPKIEAYIVDALGRNWQGPRLQIDLGTVEKLHLYYLDENGKRETPVMICRSYFRSLEQLVALLIESEAGVLPLWLQMSQVRVLPLAARNRGYAALVLDELKKNGLRASIDHSSGKLGEKVHKAEKEKIPYMLIVGDHEEKAGTVTVRTLLQDADCSGVKLDFFLKSIFK